MVSPKIEIKFNQRNQKTFYYKDEFGRTHRINIHERNYNTRQHQNNYQKNNSEFEDMFKDYFSKIL